jgi:hypothetical protein
MSRSIRVFEELDAPIAPIARPPHDTAIVGYGRGAYIGEVRGPYQSLSELAADMDNVSGGSPNDLDYDGHSAVYRWAREFMANGARRLYVVEPTVSAMQTITMTGTGSKRVFDLIADKTGGAGALTLSPIPGTVHVEYPIGTDLVENVDWIADWSQGIIYFKTAPAAAADNVQVSWNEYTAANVATAFALLENVPVTIVGGAYFASDNGNYSLIDEIRDHVDAAAALFWYRRGYGAAYWGDVATIAAKAYNNPDISLYTHKSGYFNDNITDPSVSWLEFKDPSAVVAGIKAAREAWKSLHDKPTQNLNMKLGFNSTQVATLTAAWVNYFADDGTGTFRIKGEGVTNEGSSAIYRWDDARDTWILVGNRIYDGLYAANIIGNIQIERGQILAMEQTIFTILVQLFKDGAIGDPRLLQFNTVDQLRPINSQLVDALRTAPEDRTPEQVKYIQDAQNVTRSETMRIYYDYQGALHFLDIYLGGR